MAKASELLEQSATPFDEGCVKVRELECVLYNLVKLKEYKDKHGKDERYLEEQPRLWKQARLLLELD